MLPLPLPLGVAGEFRHFSDVGSLKRLSAGVAQVVLQPEAPAPRAERNTRDPAPVSGHQLQPFAFLSGPRDPALPF
jgi:hypothetical protein